MSVCSDDAYGGVCSVLNRLCPRLVPSPLFGFSLANLARLDSEVVCGIVYGGVDEVCVLAINELSRWWFSLSRDRCSVCGSRASEIDEDWRYCVKGDAGIAVLEGLVQLCDECHLAKHLGYALTHGRSKEAIKRVAEVNNVSEELTKQAVDEAFEVHESLSKIRKWRVVLRGLSGLSESVVKVVEHVLNFMVNNNYELSNYWLWYREQNKSEIEERAENEALELLRSALGLEGRNSMSIVIKLSGEDLGKLVNELANALNNYGIRVLKRETETALRLVRGSKHIRDDGWVEIKLGSMGGKWMVFVPSGLRGVVMSSVIDGLREKGLNYIAKTPGVRECGERPVIIYVPNFLAVGMVNDVAEVMLEVLNRLGINKPLLFKPDVFTQEGIYSGKAGGMKPYIYMTSLRLKGFH